MNNELIKLVESTNNQILTEQEILLNEAYQLFESQIMDLTEKYKNGEITQEEYKIAMEGMFGNIWKKMSGQETDPNVLARQKEIAKRAAFAVRDRSKRRGEFSRLATDKVIDTQNRLGVRPGIRTT